MANFMNSDILNFDDDELENLDFVDPDTSRRSQDRNDDYASMDPIDFHRRYRLTKETFSHLHNLIGPSLASQSERVSALTPVQQLLVAIRFYASGSFQINVGDLGNISQSACCRIVQRVSRCLAGMRPDFIYMPENLTECQEIAKGFYVIGGFPGIIGAIDCTHVKIQSPGGEHAERFRNRKGFMSLNVQSIVDSNLFTRDIVVSWPGSVHDSTIYNSSRIRARFESGEFNTNFHLIGDSGYACTPHLLTPILNPASPSEMRYNKSHIRTRNTIERKYGILKRRFPCLSLGLRTQLDTTMAIIVACAVLDNLCVKLDDPLPDVTPEVQAHIDASTIRFPLAVTASQQSTGGRCKRRSIVVSHF